MGSRFTESEKKEQERIGVGIIATCTRYFNLVDPTKRTTYINGLKETVKACNFLGIPSIISQTGQELEGVSREQQRNAMIETLQECAPICEEANVILEIEPLNGLVNHKGHFLQYSDEAFNIIEEVDSPHVKLVFDVYHQQITEGNVIRNATSNSQHINHYHIADNPGRNQPGTGELNYLNILQAIKDTGFEGYIGLECGYTIDTGEAISDFKRNILEKISP